MTAHNLPNIGNILLTFDLFGPGFEPGFDRTEALENPLDLQLQSKTHGYMQM